jgi:predicted Rossmann fold nucleotide-binding protein DprA/Smf involved in DNA uptake
LSASVVQSVLLELDLAGRIQRHPGHQVSLIP